MRQLLLYTAIAACAVFLGCRSEVDSTPIAAIDQAKSFNPESALRPLPMLIPATEPTEGYVLVTPLRSTETYLVNNDRQVVHSWKSDYPPGAAYLMDNGDLVRGSRDPNFSDFEGGGIGGIIERFSWDGELLWQFRYANEEHCMHHDFHVMPNGNILMIAWERRSNEEAIEQGRDPALLKDDLWPDTVVEIEPEGETGGKVVWKWRMWDHLIQDFDREKPNFGVIYEHPELIDLNNTGSTPPSSPEELRKLRAVGYTGGGDDEEENDRRGRADWIHTNGINYNPELDQIVLSAKNFSELWIIDHSTTTEEAASHRGGNSGMGGDLLYRWGNPWSYKSGTVVDKVLFDQHDARWVPPGFPGAGNITAFNNGRGRDYSSVIEITPPIDADGQYILDDEGEFGPYELAWEYTAENPEDFYSSFISGAIRLSNGSTFVCEGAKGHYFEVSSDGKVLWEHVNPFGGELDEDGHPNDLDAVAKQIVDPGDGKGSFVENNALFRAEKYMADHPAFAGKTLEPLADQPVPFSSLVDEAVKKLRAASESKSEAEKEPTEANTTDDDSTEPEKASDE